MGITGSIVIDGRIRGSEPCLKILARLVPCECVSTTTINDGKYQSVTNIVVHRLLDSYMAGKDQYVYEDIEKMKRTALIYP